MRDGAELRAALLGRFVDAVVVDLASGNEGAWDAAAEARAFPSVPFLALSSVRSTEIAGVARACGPMEFAELIVEGRRMRRRSSSSRSRSPTVSPRRSRRRRSRWAFGPRCSSGSGGRSFAMGGGGSRPARWPRKWG